MYQGELNKVRRGELVVAGPVGHVKSPAGEVTLQAFAILLGSSSSDQFDTSFQYRSEDHESGDLRPSLDREAGA